MTDHAAALELLVSAVAADRSGKAGVARKLGVSRPILARVLSANDPTPLSKKLARRVIQTYGVVICPATGEAALIEDCRRAVGPAPTHNPAAVRLWRQCRACPYKGSKPEDRERALPGGIANLNTGEYQ
ncbi:MAG: hypothetical protein LBO00_04045 [Zoogloeaceae bacterium]|jgi:hypothetical protein|nr:hypothetical protein [Zoogloeaceae bacterium]